MVTYYHGSRDTSGVLEALLGGGCLRNNFHLTPSIEVARNYGRVIEITVECELTEAHVGLINKDGNYNKAVGNGIEVVLKTQSAVNQLLFNLYDAVIVE
jgi:hypothetical protein